MFENMAREEIVAEIEKMDHDKVYDLYKKYESGDLIIYWDKNNLRYDVLKKFATLEVHEFVRFAAKELADYLLGGE